LLLGIIADDNLVQTQTCEELHLQRKITSFRYTALSPSMPKLFYFHPHLVFLMQEGYLSLFA
jgi:hypothetical protein